MKYPLIVQVIKYFQEYLIIKNRSIKNIKDDYSQLHKDICKYHFINRYWFDTYYFWPDIDFDFDETIWDRNLEKWENYCEKFNSIKEDRNIMKKKYKNKGKRKHVNFRILNSKKNIIQIIVIRII